MRRILNINQNWIFLKNTEKVPAEMPETAEVINLPHTWNASDGQDGGNDYFRGSCCYVKKIRKDELPDGELYFLEINGANNSADVYVNGKKLAHHDNGYSTWRVNITGVLEENNIIAIIVDNAPTELVYPQTADFTFYGGLYRDANVVAVPRTHFELESFGGKGLKITPIMEGADAKVAIEVSATELQTGDQYRYIIKDAAGQIVEKTQTVEKEWNFTIENAHLWDGTKDPYLYMA
ncbi:MAG: glycoside hydrolase family 2 protein, partial [Lachnospiraceae bacterium]|nr:glycoside hydrolase family 2 protein [Lachnospiraceae bacterium]